jgi:hypothetical protein
MNPTIALKIAQDRQRELRAENRKVLRSSTGGRWARVLEQGRRIRKIATEADYPALDLPNFTVHYPVAR